MNKFPPASPPKNILLDPISNPKSPKIANIINSHALPLSRPKRHSKSSARDISKLAPISGPYYIPIAGKGRDGTKSPTSPSEKTAPTKAGDSLLNNSDISGIPPALQSPNNSVSNTSIRKVSLPQLNSVNHFDLSMNLNSTVNGSINEGSTMLNIMNSSDYVKQAEYINMSPHFAKFNRLNHLLGRMEAKKSSLAKELFYYPEQIELNQKLQEIAIQSTEHNEDADAGIINLPENKRQAVNLLEGRKAYFRLPCYKKKFPLKVKVDVFTGSYEFCISKSTKRPGLDNYDFLQSKNEFDIMYENPREIKYLYIAVVAMERLRISFLVNFKEEKMKHSLPLIHSNTQPRIDKARRRNVYEFFKKDMGPTESQNLKKIAEDIMEEKKKKLMALTNNKNIMEDNLQMAHNYDIVRTNQIVDMVTKREIKMRMNKKNKNIQEEEREKKLFLGQLREDLRIIKTDFEAQASEKHRKTVDFQVSFLLTATLCNLCQAIKERKRTFAIVKLIQERLSRKAIKIQRAVRAFLSKPLVKNTNRMNRDFPSQQESKIVLNMFKALNMWATVHKNMHLQKANETFSKFMGDVLVPLKILGAIGKYKEKVLKVQAKWKQRKEMENARVDLFSMYWDKYCMGLIADEKNKPKKPNSDALKLISRDHVRKYGRKFVKERLRGLFKFAAVFVTMQHHMKQQNERRTSINLKPPQVQEPQKRKVSMSKPNLEQSNLANRRGSKANVEQANTANRRGSIMSKKLDTVETLPAQSMQSTKQKSKIRPTEEDLKAIFDQIIAELKAENKL